MIASILDGATVTAACSAAGISKTTFYRWRNTEAAFLADTEAAFDRRVQHVEDSLYQVAVSGKPSGVNAAIFWLCNRAYRHWRNISTIEHRGSKSVTVMFQADGRPQDAVRRLAAEEAALAAGADACGPGGDEEL